jgi:Ca-activated chloride channel family protein
LFQLSWLRLEPDPRYKIMNTHLFRRVLLYCFVAVILGPAFISLPPAGIAQQADTPEGYNKKGLEFYEAGKFAEAIKAYDEAIKLKPGYGEAYANRGDAYLRSGQFKKAVESYKQAVQFKPDLSTAHNNMGTAYYKLGEYKKAIAAYTQALKINPKAPSTYYNLGAAYIARGDKKSAVEQYKILKGLDAQTAENLYLMIYRPVATVIDTVGQAGVRLTVRVSDSRGNALANLRQEDFTVTENDAPQTISFFSKEEAPIIYGLVVDNSGSFNDVIGAAVTASKILVNTNLPGDETVVVRFVDSDKIETMQEFTSDKKLLEKAIDGMYIEGGQTAILDTVYLSAEHVAQRKPFESAYRRAVIMLTDGEERDSYYNIDAVIELLRKLDVEVFFIVMPATSKNNVNERQRLNKSDALQKIADETGGQIFRSKTAAELEGTVKQILNLIRTQYVIGYKPTAPATTDKKFRKVEVRVAEAAGREKATVKTRAGYLVPEKTPER